MVDEPAAVVEIGGAAGWNLKDAGSSFGPDLAVEVTPIENWLELEAGTTPFFSRGGGTLAETSGRAHSGV